MGTALGDRKVQRVAVGMVCQSRPEVKVSEFEEVEDERIRLWFHPGCTLE